MPPLYPPYLCSSETQSLSVLPEDLGTYDRVAVLMENATVPDSLRVALTTALTSMQSNPNGWNTVLQPTVTAESVALVTNSTIRISLGAVSTYATALPETLTLVVPPALVASQQPLTATFGVDGEAESALLLPDAGHVTINGSFVGRARADIRSEETHVIGLTLAAAPVGPRRRPRRRGERGAPRRPRLRAVGGARLEQRAAWRRDAPRLRAYLADRRRHGGGGGAAGRGVLGGGARDAAVLDPRRGPRLAPLDLRRRAAHARRQRDERRARPPGHAHPLVEPPRGRGAALALELQVALSDDVGHHVHRRRRRRPARRSPVSNGSRGWDAVAQPALSADNFTRLNDSTLAITLGGVEEFDVRDAEPERIRVEVPAVAVASRVPRIVEPLLRVDPVAHPRPRRTLARPTDDDGVDRWRRAQGARDGGAGQQRHVARDCCAGARGGRDVAV